MKLASLCTFVALTLVALARAELPADAYRSTAEIIRDKGYPCEEYDVVTDDGFILSVQRIPHGANETVPAAPRPAIYLQHGLVCQTGIWVTDYLTTIPYYFADRGYDVWLVNSRARPEPRHVSLKPSDPAFWAWSWDEMAQYDVKAAISHIRQVTGVATIKAMFGHSQGGTIGYASFTAYPSLAKQVDVFVSLGGPAFPPPSPPPNDTTTVQSIGCPKCTDDWPGCCNGGLGMTQNNTWSPVACEADPSLCASALCLLTGCESPSNFNASRLPVFLTHWPAYTSVQNNAHWAQTNSGFAMFDYGTAAANTVHYGQSTPPVYDLGVLGTDVIVAYGKYDHLCPLSTTLKYLPLIPKERIVWATEFDYGHMDFVMGKNAPETIWSKIDESLRAHKRK